MGQMIQDSGWRIPDALWEQMVPLLPPRPRHPLGCHNPRVPDRAAMDAIFFVLRTGSQWGALCCATIKTPRPATIWHTSDGGAASGGQAGVKPEDARAAVLNATATESL